jgi:hypothetical protein
VVISEIGVDMSRFPPPLTWPPGLVSILTEAAWAAARTRTRIGARYHRLHRRFGGRANPGAGRKATFAIAHTLIKVIWTILSPSRPYQDLGHDFYTRRVDPATQTRRLITQALSGKKIVFVENGTEIPPPGITRGRQHEYGREERRHAVSGQVRPQGPTRWSSFPPHQPAADTTRRQARHHRPNPRHAEELPHTWLNPSFVSGS